MQDITRKELCVLYPTLTCTYTCGVHNYPPDLSSSLQQDYSTCTVSGCISEHLLTIFLCSRPFFSISRECCTCSISSCFFTCSLCSCGMTDVHAKWRLTRPGLWNSPSGVKINEPCPPLKSMSECYPDEYQPNLGHCIHDVAYCRLNRLSTDNLVLNLWDLSGYPLV